MRTLCDECVPTICVNVKTHSVNSISIISHVFSSSSGVFCQDMIDSCAKAVLSDVCLAQAQSGVSDLCLSGAHRHPGEIVRRYRDQQYNFCVLYFSCALSAEVFREKACLAVLYIHHSR